MSDTGTLMMMALPVGWSPGAQEGGNAVHTQTEAAQAQGMGTLRHFGPAELESPGMIPVVVEFQQAPVAVYKARNPSARPAEVAAYAARLRRLQAAFLAQFRAQGIPVHVSSTAVRTHNGGEARVAHAFHSLFNGLGLVVPGAAVIQLASHPHVRVVTRNQERLYLNLDRSVNWIGAPAVWGLTDASGRPVTGEGIIIAVIDTGVDYTHPAFGGYTTVPNPKVIHAVSYTGEPPADNFGHGTHVAAIAGGDLYRQTPRGDSRVRGVAPGARLMSYKVLTANGSGSATNIILAIEDAVKRGAHVLNLSLGDPSGDPLSPEAVAANNAMRAGVMVCCAAGNAGPERMTVGTPGAAELVLTVGASTDDGVSALFAHLQGEGGSHRAIAMRLLSGSTGLSQPGARAGYVSCGQGRGPGDFPAAVRGRIALIGRGGNTFREKATLAQKADALAAMIYNNQPGNFFGTLGDAPPGAPALRIPVVSISKEDGELLLGEPRGEDGVFRNGLELDPRPVPQPDQVAEFSSRGPTRDNRLKPDLCAPGVDIFSATILPEMAPPTPGLGNMADPAGYTSVSGTSMATPHLAGACALLKQLHPGWDALTIKAVLMNTARWMDGQGDATVQGTGRVDLQRAARANRVLVTAGATPGASHSFGLIEHQGQRVTVQQAFRVLDLGAPAAATGQVRLVWIRRAPGLSARISQRLLVIPPGAAAGFGVSLRINGSKVPDGTYMGLVEVRVAGQRLRLPLAVTLRGAIPSVPPGPGAARDPGQPVPRGDARCHR